MKLCKKRATAKERECEEGVVQGGVGEVQLSELERSSKHSNSSRT